MSNRKQAALPTCEHCGDVAGFAYQGKRCCQDCLAELRDGVIKNYNINFFGGVSATCDDESPWQQNAIRAMEG